MAKSQRYNYIFYLFVIVFIVLGCRIFYLQVIRRDFLCNRSQDQYYRLIRLEGSRGKIFDRNGKILAKGLNFYSIFADPKLIENLNDTAQKLAAYLEIPKSAVRSKLERKKRFVWLKRKISLESKKKIESFKFKGIDFIKEEKRVYPEGKLASSLLGIVNIDNQGLEGVELGYNQYLSGKNGFVRVLQDSASREITVSTKVLVPKKGADLTLTIDSHIQYWTEKFLQETVLDYKARAGSVVVLKADTGEVLALANFPFFDPNNFDGNSLKFLKNNAITDTFEPGSVFKIVTLIAAIEEDKYDNEDIIFCENGQFKVPGTTLHDWRPYGNLTFEQVFKKSSNIGVAKIASSLGSNILYHYICRLGFGQRSGIDLDGEVSGMIKPVSKWSNTSPYIMPIGQEVGVNLVQLARALAVVANGGYLIEPYVVKRINAPFFEKENRPKRKRIIKAETAQRAKDILIEVVSDGTGKRAQVPGVVIGGKTGTAQKYDTQIRRYSPDDFRASFIGFISDEEMPIVIAVSIDEPRKHHFGGVVAAPLFKRIAEKVNLYVNREKLLNF
ncbi:MAG: penicillin-binding protein 2 [Candidatus Omnitrophica bacterium]|nr:penicillin-binding protein 2 [Candidatus Omnitrophota bacterium]